MGLKEIDSENKKLVEIAPEIENSLSYQIIRLLKKKDTPDEQISALCMNWLLHGSTDFFL